MADVFEDLKRNEILQKSSVLALRQYIDQKYPYDPPKTTSKIFADAVHKIIDNHITQFDAHMRPHIKKNLLKEVVEKEAFEINAFEIYKACAQMDIHDDMYLDCLTNWLNHHQSDNLYKERVVELTRELRQASTDDMGEQSQQPTIFLDESSLVSTNDIQAPLPIVIERSTAEPLELMTPFELSTLKLSTLKPIALKQKNYGKAIMDVFQVVLQKWNKYLQNLFLTVAKQKIVVIFFAIITMTSIGLVYQVVLSQKVDAIQYSSNEYALSSPEDISPVYIEASKGALGSSQDANELQYQEINLEALRSWLIEKDSMLAEEPYYMAIITAAKNYNVNPLLLFAITGQEQSFVPKSNLHALEIANNPFNVFGSWEDYNTDIEDAASIAAKTVINLSKDCPEDVELIQWINRKYAEDPYWHIGVSKIYIQLKDAVINVLPED